MLGDILSNLITNEILHGTNFGSNRPFCYRSVSVSGPSEAFSAVFSPALLSRAGHPP